MPKRKPKARPEPKAKSKPRPRIAPRAKTKKAASARQPKVRAQAKPRLGRDFDRVALSGLIDQIKKNPDAGKTLWKASTRWRGGLRSEAKIREFTVAMDEPTPLGGSDTAPNMVEMVLGAYGCCLITGYTANAALRGIALEDVRIDIEGDLDLNGFFGLKDPNACWPGYTAVRAVVTLVAPTASRADLAELHEAVRATSPVGSILARPIEVSAVLAEA